MCGVHILLLQFRTAAAWLIASKHWKSIVGLQLLVILVKQRSIIEVSIIPSLNQIRAASCVKCQKNEKSMVTFTPQVKVARICFSCEAVDGVF